MSEYINKDDLQGLLYSVDITDLPADRGLMVYYKEDVDALSTYTEVDIARAIIRKLKTNIKKRMHGRMWIGGAERRVKSS